MNWIDVTIGEICELNYGFNLPKGRRKEGNVPVLSSAGYIDYHDEAKVTGPGIVVGRKGSIGTVYYTDKDYYPIDTCYYIKPNHSRYDIKFLYYALKVARLDRFNNDAAVPGLNRNTAYAQKLSLPPLDSQRHIASILSAYDDLIENNLKRIKLLEEAAQNIYREWFVNMRFPGWEEVKFKAKGGELPHGWQKLTFGDILELNYGKALHKDGRIENGEYPVYGSAGVVGYHDNYIVKSPGVILGRKGNVGATFFSQKDFHPIDTVYYVTSNHSLLYIFHVLKNEIFVNTDAAVPGLNRNYALSKPVILPSNDILSKFDSLTSIIYQQIEVMENQVAILKEARDILLPRLMNRTIEV